MSLTAIVSDWVASLRWEDLPTDVIEYAKVCFLDHLGCAAGGALSTPGRISAEMALGWGGPSEATVIGAPLKVAARNAAFANGMMANALDYDDTLLGHPGATTFPASLAAAEKWSASGKDFLLAAIIGYEISVRSAALLKPILPRFTAIWDAGAVQAFGATAAAARLAGLDGGEIANALGIISATAPIPLPRKARLTSGGRPMTKSCHGWAAQSAIVATEVSLAGMSGPAHALDGHMGFWEMTPSAEMGITDFADKLGEQWCIRRISFKPYMSCRFIHPVLQGTEELRRRTRIVPDEIKAIEVDSFSLLADEHHYILRPVSITDAQFSVPYTLAAMLIYGSVSPESYSEENLTDPRMLSLMDKVKVHIDPNYDHAYPEALGAGLRITLLDGRTEEIHIDNPKGSPEHPMTPLELYDKFESLTAPLLGKEVAIELAQRVDEIERISDMTALTRMLTK